MNLTAEQVYEVTKMVRFDESECKLQGINRATFYTLKADFSGMTTAQIEATLELRSKVKRLDAEVTRLTNVEIAFTELKKNISEEAENMLHD